MITICVAEGLRPSSSRENVEPNIRDSINKREPRPLNTIKLKGGGDITEATRRLGCWESELHLAVGEEDVRKTVCAVTSRVVALTR